MAAPDERHVGEYGHYVQPLRQLLLDGSVFLGAAELSSFEGEARRIMREGQGVHGEEASFLYALVRALRPDFVLETGTFKGYSTAELARALEANGSGRLATVDIDPEAGTMVPEHLRRFVTFHRGIPADALPRILHEERVKIDIFFHDSLHTYAHTLSELIWVAPFLKDGAVVLCHDAKMDFKPGFGVGRALREFAAGVGLPCAVLDTTCGIGMLRWRGPVGVERLSGLEKTLWREQRDLRMERVVRGVVRRVKGIIGS